MHRTSGLSARSFHGEHYALRLINDGLVRERSLNYWPDTIIACVLRLMAVSSLSTFRRLCRYAGQAVRPQIIQDEVAQVLGPGVRNRAVQDAIRFLANALLVCEIPPLEALTKRQAHPSKLCLCDHFVREAWLLAVVLCSGRHPSLGWTCLTTRCQYDYSDG